ncbi:Aldehyde dehydrogenase B [hydrothermal vent metagenome]|uniref:aldehyde dehydrogenase (NAD(+)) n=1 Tax=hydrothermal vent metagenome TaxID=652676 RepID=A0A3B1A6E5_9ZZZZ
MELLHKLNITELNTGFNSGACTGPNWLQQDDNNLIESINPSTEKTIASISCATQINYEEIIKNSQQAQQFWRIQPAPLRGEFIRNIGNELRLHKSYLGNLIALEMGKIKQEGDGEVQEMIDIADFAVGQSRMLYGKTMHSERPQHRMYEQWHPLGVVGVISAFNFPMAVWAWNAFIASICGNTVIWKPSSQVPLCAIAVQNICNKVMKDMGYSGLFSLFITNNNTDAELFVADKRINLISFTGSTSTGRRVNSIVANRLGRSLLELSGNNAIILDETADLKLAIPGIVFGAAGTSGQRCTTTRRLFIHYSIYPNVIKQLINAYQQIKIGDPLENGVLMGPLINANAINKFKETISTIKNDDGEILFGGKILDTNGFYVEPTIVALHHNASAVLQETFAPILYIMPYQSIQDAIAMQNEVSHGLSSAIFTNNFKTAELFLSSIGSDCGIANVNIGTSGAEIGGAFGGEKDTGGGREAGSDSWKQYMRRQTNTCNWGNELPLAQGIKFEL